MAQKFHFIAIGGAVMHQLAIYLHKQGNTVSGSDDVIFDPALSQLNQHGILPDEFGWFAERIDESIDAVILGMHAKAGNPELDKALSLNIPVFSFPEFIYERSLNKKRLVIAGSHGKTSITSMIMHVLKDRGIDFDYLVGARIDGFDTMVRVTEEAKCIIIEGDEYLSSAIDLRSKFLHYHPHVAVISGIAWDHINVFPEFSSYLDTFSEFIKSIDKDGQLFYYEQDEHLPSLIEAASCTSSAYEAFDWKEEDGLTIINFDGRAYPVNVFGKHNMENIKAAVLACGTLDLNIHDCLTSLGTFQGSAKRLEEIFRDEAKGIHIYRDFAHAPSKLKASTNALRSKYPDKMLIAVFELHTYSSLQVDFLQHYAHSLDAADHKAVFLDAHALQIKGRPDIADEVIADAFADQSINIIRNADSLEQFARAQWGTDVVYAFMSSGNFADFDPESLVD